MNHLKREIEAVQISIYTNILLNMFRKHKEISLAKAIVFSYIIKTEYDYPDKIYTANNKQELVYKGLSFLEGKFDEFSNSLEYIIKSIYILVRAKKLELDDSSLKILSLQDISGDGIKESNFLEKVIEKSKLMSDKQFMREVLSHV